MCSGGQRLLLKKMLASNARKKDQVVFYIFFLDGAALTDQNKTFPRTVCTLLHTSNKKTLLTFRAVFLPRHIIVILMSVRFEVLPTQQSTNLVTNQVEGH